MNIKSRIRSQHPNLNSRLLCSRDTLYITSNKVRDEQYIYPLANIASIEFKLALDVLDATERVNYDVAPMETLICLTTVRGSTMFFLARNSSITFDYYGYEDENK